MKITSRHCNVKQHDSNKKRQLLHFKKQKPQSILDQEYNLFTIYEAIGIKIKFSILFCSKSRQKQNKTINEKQYQTIVNSFIATLKV